MRDSSNDDEQLLSRQQSRAFVVQVVTDGLKYRFGIARRSMSLCRLTSTIPGRFTCSRVRCVDDRGGSEVACRKVLVAVAAMCLASLGLADRAGASGSVAAAGSVSASSSPVGEIPRTRQAVVNGAGDWIVYSREDTGSVVLRSVASGQEWSTTMPNLHIGGFLGQGHELLLFSQYQVYKWSGDELVPVGPVFPRCGDVTGVVPSPLGGFAAIENAVELGTFASECTALGNFAAISVLDTTSGALRNLTPGRLGGSYAGVWTFDGVSLGFDQGSFDIATQTLSSGSQRPTNTATEGYLDPFTTASRRGMDFYAYDPRLKVSPSSPFVNYNVIRDGSTGAIYKVPMSDYGAPSIDYASDLALRTDYANNPTMPLGQFSVVDLRSGVVTAVDSQAVVGARFTGGGRFIVLVKLHGIGAAATSSVEIRRTPAPLPAMTISPVASGAPPGTSAALVNLTMVDGAAPGFLTADACNALKPGPQTRSNGNFVQSTAIANLSVVPVDADGRFCVYNSTPVNEVADVQGYFAPSMTDGELFVPSTPIRLIDTRRAPSTSPAAGSITRVQTGVAAGTSAVVVNLTMVDGSLPGYITADRCSALAAGAQTKSSGNHAVGAAIANVTVVPVDADGSFCVYNQEPVNLVVDLQGSFTSAATGSLGFTSLTPSRKLDTRLAPAMQPPLGTVTKVNTGVVTGTAAVLVNLTMTDGAASGFITADRCSTLTAGPQTKSSGNFGVSAAIANLAVVPVDVDGSFCVYNSQPVNLVVDVQGAFSPTGAQRFFTVAPKRVLDTRS